MIYPDMRPRVLLLSFLLGLTSLSWSQVASNSANPGATYYILQWAVDAGTTNYTVWLYGGEMWGGNLTITNKRNMNLIHSPDWPGTVRIMSPSTGSGTAITLSNCTNVTIQGLAIGDFSMAIKIGPSCSNIRITGCDLYSNSSVAVTLTGPVAAGCQISSNTFWAANGTGVGVAIQDGSHSNLVWSNRFSGLGYGIVLGSLGACSNNIIWSNQFFSNSSRAMMLVSSRNCDFRFNTIEQGPSAGGFLFAGSTARSNKSYSNVFIGCSTAINCDGAGEQQIVSNVVRDCYDYGIAVWNSPSFRNLIQGNDVQNVQRYAGIQAGTSSGSNWVVGNRVRACTLGIQVGDGVYGSEANIVASNEVFDTTVDAIRVSGYSHQTLVASNHLHDNFGRGFLFALGATNLALHSNLIVRNGGKGVWLSNNTTNASVGWNTVGGNAVGLHVSLSGTAHRVFFNNLTNHGASNLVSDMLAPGLVAVSNYFGDAARAFADKGIATPSNAIVDPWLNGPIGYAGDFALPARPVALVASNGAAGKVNLHWGAAIPGDFSEFRLWRTRFASAYSNLTAGDLLTTITASATTQYIDSPVAGGDFYYYATVRDTSGNESWYSPQAWVDYLSNAPPVASFSGPAHWATNLAATFASTSDRGTGQLTNFIWDFGDGTIIAGSNLSLSHVYPSPLSTWVQLTAFNNLGQSHTASNRLEIHALAPITGLVGGTMTHGATLTLSGATGVFTTVSATNGFLFLASNGAFTLTPSRLGYRFTPPSRTLSVTGSPIGGQDFTAADIYPTLSFPAMTNRQYVVRDLELNAVSDAPEILSTVTYSIASAAGTPTFSTQFTSAYGRAAVFDTTLQEDGLYTLKAEAVDFVFGRAHTNSLLCYMDNQVFKVLGKGLEERRAIIYDSVRELPRDSAVELFFFVKAAQPVGVGIYDKAGRRIWRFPERQYPHGHHRLVWSPIPADLPAGVYYAHVACSEFTRAVPLVILRR